ncbi:MAG: sel1 repeat family protein [Alphaproteobacteria bacterium]|nr:sel1 repeat family protein [Alphaproteobacteria bacterium]
MAGQKAYNAQQWQTAVTELRPLADAGDVRAMILLANMYENGYGLVVSHTEAMRLYKRAAISGNNPQAMDAVGAMYVDGRGVTPDLKTARAWFLRSASLGDQTGALFSAIILYEGNKNIFNPATPDLPEAYKWYRICAAETQKPAYAKACARAAEGLAKKFLKKGEAARLDKEAASWKPVVPKDLGPAPPDPVPPSKAELRNRVLRTLKRQDTPAVRPDPVLP